jgi:dephospho-CoA kinase
MMLRAGLTGGIGCGKSTVAAMLRTLGFPVLDADPLGHALLEPGLPAFADVLREFGAGILDAQGRVDRARLAANVFEDASKLEALNRILHPRIRELIEKQFREWERPGGPAAGIIEAALLLESGYRDSLSRIIVVWCHPEQQRERLLARGMPARQIDLRIAAQMPLAEKRRLATDEIDNSGRLEDTRRQVESLAAGLHAGPR